MKLNVLLLLLATAFLVQLQISPLVYAQSAKDSAQAYKGKVEMRGLQRVARPLPNAASDFAIPKLKSAASSSNLKGESLFSRTEFIKTSPMNASTDANSSPLKDEQSNSSLKSNAIEQENRPETKSAEKPAAVQTAAPAPMRASVPEAQPEENSGKAGQARGKKIVIRLKRYRSLSEMEVVWEAARAGIRWLKKGANVTILLDMDGVHAASKSESGQAWYEPNRGNGNSSGEKITSPQDQLSTFVQCGGRLVVSERWAKLGALSSLVSGTQLLSEDAIDDILIDPEYTVISY